MPELWPFAPDADCSETLATATDVLAAHSAEQRISLAPSPRQTLRYDYTTTAATYSDMELLYRTQPLGEWYVPLWFDSVLVGGLSSAATSISVDVTDRFYEVGRRLVIWDNDGKAETALIDAISGSAITLSAGISQAFTNATIAPVMTGLCMGGVSVTRSDRYFVDASVSFLSTDTSGIAATAYDQYQSVDVLTDRSIMLFPLSGVTYQIADLSDSGLGAIEFEASEDYVRQSSAIQFADEGAARLTRRKWLYSLNGRQEAFWVPTWHADLELASNIGASDTVITVDSARDSADERHILIELTDGTRFYRQITSVSGADLTISSSLGQAVTTGEIRVISFMEKMRMEADSLTIRHDGNNYSEFQAAVVTA